MSKNKISTARNALIFIPDISGYTRFVHEMDIKFGREIIYELLSKILDSNFLNLKISEIEGDAVLFYRFGDPPAFEEVFAQYEAMLIAFKKKLRDMDKQYHLKEFELSLKLIVHYGPVAEYNLYGFRKLYGETINEAHILLKNNVPGNNYVLVTKSLLDRIDGWEAERARFPEWIRDEVTTCISIGPEKMYFSYFLYDTAKFKSHVLKTDGLLNTSFNEQHDTDNGER